ncbi:ABC transporter permease [Nesterenkonia suensis]
MADTRSPATSTAAPVPAKTSPWARTGALIRFMLRRDRLRLSIWVLGIGVLALYFATAIQMIADDVTELAQMATLFGDPVGRMMTGPAFGMDAPSFARFYSAGYVLFVYLLIALMSIFLLVRHTRAEEQAGRVELIRATAVGRHATLTAALLLTAAANAVVAVLVWTASGPLAGYDAVGSALVAAGGFAVGLFFLGAATVSAQITRSSRGASAMAGAVLGLAYLIRLGGDMVQQGGSALSWFSPLAWSQQTAPYVEDRWWPLLLPLCSAAALITLGLWLSARRDVGASLLPPRLGRATARPSLGTATGLALRVLRGVLRGWAVALVLAAMMFGGYAESMVDAAEGLPEEVAMLMSGDDLMLGYLAYMSLFLAIFVAAAGVSGMQVLRGEEVHGRAELVLSLPLSRVRWLAAHLVVLLIGLVVMLLLIGLGTAVGAAAALGDASLTGDLLLAGLHQFPAVFAVVGLVVALFGWVPRIAGALGWVMIAFAGIATNFGPLLELPEPVLALNLFGHLAQVPVEAVALTPLLWLLGVGAAGIGVGLVGWRGREVDPR